MNTKWFGRLPLAGRNKLRIAAYWLLPSLICLWLHRDGLHCWFQADDFAWLGANTEYPNLKTLWPALWHPAAQGTLRPLSERLFFFAFWHWFGWNALPYRLFVAANQCANLLLLSYVVRRVSGSGLAGFVAPILWVANAALVVPMAWSSSYNEVLCATFLLGATAFWLRFAATRRRLDYFLQLIVFTLGFGALELNLIYPALAAAWALFFRWRSLPLTIPMFAISAIYYAVHAALVPLQSAGPYQPHFDWGMAATLGRYWSLAWLPPYGYFTVHPWLASAILTVATAASAAFVIGEIRARRYAAVYFLCWFPLALAPLLPFRDHVTHYYLTIPLIGIAAFGAVAISRWKVAGTALAAIYFTVQIPAVSLGEQWYLGRSREARSLVMGVRQVHGWEPGKSILLAGVSKDLYGFTVADSPFRLIPSARVYLSPDAAERITDLPANLAPVSRFTLPAGPVRHALLDRELVVYSAAHFPLEEITGPYLAQVLAAPEPEDPRRVDPGSPAMAYLLGPGWYPLEGPYRWMAKRAALRMGAPRDRSQKLYLSGFADPESLPLHLSVTAEGAPAGTAEIRPGEGSFERALSLPAHLTGKSSVEIGLEVSRTVGRDRQLGLAFGTFEIR